MYDAFVIIQMIYSPYSVSIQWLKLRQVVPSPVYWLKSLDEFFKFIIRARKVLIQVVTIIFLILLPDWVMDQINQWLRKIWAFRPHGFERVGILINIPTMSNGERYFTGIIMHNFPLSNPILYSRDVGGQSTPAWRMAWQINLVCNERCPHHHLQHKLCGDIIAVISDYIIPIA